MALESTARTHWDGDLQSGSGTTTLDSGAAGPLPVSWKARAEERGAQTSPEELIAAAHASCYSMALAAGLARAGTPPTSLDTEVTVTFDLDGGPHISKAHITVKGQVPGIDEDGFRQAAEAAKDGCPVSKALTGNVELSVDAVLAE